jgi:hypothetical protein
MSILKLLENQPDPPGDTSRFSNQWTTSVESLNSVHVQSIDRSQFIQSASGEGRKEGNARWGARRGARKGRRRGRGQVRGLELRGGGREQSWVVGRVERGLVVMRP